MATHSPAQARRGGAWGVSVIGAALVVAALAYGSRFATANMSLFPVMEFVVLVGLAGTVLITGRWLRTSDLTESDLWRIAISMSLGIILLVSLTLWQLLTQVRGGATLRNPLLTLVVTQTVGATAGLLVGISHVRSVQNARAAENAAAAADEARAGQDQLAFVHTLVRHHMRNGMHVIQSYAKQLETHVDAEGASHLTTIQRRTERLVRLVEELQPLANSIDPDERLSAVRVTTIIQREASHFEETHPDSSVEVTSPEEEPLVRADSLLPAAFENLLRCAIEHSGTPGPDVEVTIECAAETCRVGITASGPTVNGGIDHHFLNAAHDDENAGIHIAREVLDRYDGSLSVGRENSGPQFTVELPLDEE